ncbi:hypothetical protein D3C75_836470 [compost metagenome]
MQAAFRRHRRHFLKAKALQLLLLKTGQYVPIVAQDKADFAAFNKHTVGKQLDLISAWRHQILLVELFELRSAENAATQ